MCYKSPGMVEDFREKTLPYRAAVLHSLALHSARDSLRSDSVRGSGSRSCFKDQKENQIQIQEQKTKDSEGSPRQTQSKARLALMSCPGTPISRLAGCETPIGRLAFPGVKTKTGNLAAPRFSAFFFAVVALISASGGTHRVRGVIVAVAVLSPVESCSPPKLFEQQFPSTPMPDLWQERLCNFHSEGIQRGQF
jgi:hypothetical protein